MNQPTERQANLLQCTAALRSAEYKQGYGALRQRITDPTLSDSGDRWCCLGVITNEYHKATGNGEWVTTPQDACWVFVVGGGRYDVRLPPEVADWCGLHDSDPYISDGEVSGRASKCNDTYGWNFTHIADGFEKQYITSGDSA